LVYSFYSYLSNFMKVRITRVKECNELQELVRFCHVLNQKIVKLKKRICVRYAKSDYA